MLGGKNEKLERIYTFTYLIMMLTSWGETYLPLKTHFYLHNNSASKKKKNLTCHSKPTFTYLIIMLVRRKRKPYLPLKFAV